MIVSTEQLRVVAARLGGHVRDTVDHQSVRAPGVEVNVFQYPPGGTTQIIDIFVPSEEAVAAHVRNGNVPKGDNTPKRLTLRNATATFSPTDPESVTLDDRKRTLVVARGGEITSTPKLEPHFMCWWE